MWKETTATEPPKTTTPAAPAKPVTEDELRSILERCRNQPGTFSARTGNCGVFCPAAKARRRHCGTRNAELEEIMRQFAPTLLNIATTMGLAAKNEMNGMRKEGLKCPRRAGWEVQSLNATEADMRFGRTGNIGRVRACA